MIIEKLRNLRGQSIAVRSIVPRWGLATEPPVKLFNREIKGEEELLEPEWKIFISPSFFAKPRRWPISHTRSQTETCSIRHHCSPIDASHTAYVPNISCWWLYLFAFLILQRSRLHQHRYRRTESLRAREIYVLNMHTHTHFSWIYRIPSIQEVPPATHTSLENMKIREEVSFLRFVSREKIRLENIETTKADQVEGEEKTLLCFSWPFCPKFLFQRAQQVNFSFFSASASTRFWWLHSYGAKHKNFQKKNS